MRCAWIEHFVDTVTDAHDFFFALQFSFNEGFDLIKAADFFEHVDHSLVSTAVKRTFERANGGGHRGIEIGESRYGHTSGERRGVHAVIGVQGVGDVENFRSALGWSLAIDEVEKMSCLGEIGANGRKFEALAEAVESCDDDGSFGDQRNGDKCIGRHVGFTDFGAFVVEAEHRYAGAENIHGVGILGCGFEEIEHALRQFALCAQLLIQGVEFRLVRQMTVMQEVSDFFKGTVSDQFIDAIAEITQATLCAFDVGECGFIGDNAF